MKSNMLIGVVVAIQLAGMLVFQLLVIRFIGLGPETDAYIAAQAVPTFLNAVVGSALQSVWLQRLSIMQHDQPSWHAEQTLAQGQAAVLGGTVVVFLMATATWWVPTLYPGFSKSLTQNITGYSLVLLIATLLNTQATLLTAALRARDRFLAAEVIALLGTVMALLAVCVLVPVWGIWSVVWIWLMRSIVIYLVQMHILGWPWPAFLEGLRLVETWRKIRPLLFSASLTKTAPLVDRFWASQAQAGGMTALGLAQQGVGGLSTVLERAISVPLIPSLSRLLECGNVREARARYRKRVLFVLLLTGIIATLLWGGRSSIGQALIRVLNVSSDDAVLIWNLVVLLSGFLFVSIAGTIVMSVLYALGEMTIAAKISIGGFLLGLLLKWLFFEGAGVIGLAIAISLSYLATFLIGVTLVEFKLREMEIPRD